VLKFTVLISVCASERPIYFQECLQSIIDQSLACSELVLVQDGPLPIELLSVIDFYSRELPIVSVVLDENEGLAAALNRGLGYCTHDIVARMDTDDICIFDRFEKQILFMQQNPDVDVLGAWIEEYDVTMTKSLGVRYTPLDSTKIMRFARRRSPISHPSVMFRKSAVLAVGGYPNFRKAQDYALWSLMLTQGYKMQNLGEVLLKMRAGDGLLERRGGEYLKHELRILKYQYEIGFINSVEYVTNYIARSVVRLSPPTFKRIFYRLWR